MLEAHADKQGQVDDVAVTQRFVLKRMSGSPRQERARAFTRVSATGFKDECDTVVVSLLECGAQYKCLRFHAVEA